MSPDVTRRAARRAGRAIALLLALPIGAASGQVLLEAREAARYPAPGRQADVGGRKVHVDCMGQGSATVVFESSGLSGAAEWERILPEVARRTRACAYDRAGMGWSDPVGGSRTARDFVDDLSAALESASERPPYVLVGHSAGGVLVRAFQAVHPSEVSALVLVDTATASVMARWPRVVPAWHRTLRFSERLARLGLVRVLNPLNIRGRSAAFTYRARTFGAADQLVGAIAAALPSLPEVSDLPTVVLAHGRAGDWAGPGILDPDDAPAIERDWQAAQRELAAGPHGSLVVAERSGHMIPEEQPELLVSAVASVLGR